MDNTSDLRILLASRHPLVLGSMRDESRFLGLLRDAAGELDLPVWTWSITNGLRRDGGDPLYQTTDPGRALDTLSTIEGEGVFVFCDVHHALEDPAVVRRLKELALGDSPGRTVVLTGPSLDVPPELQGLALPWELRPPTPDELTDLVRRTLDDLASRKIPVTLDPDDVPALAEALRGLSLREAEGLLGRAAVRDGTIDRSDLGFVRDGKADLLEAGGALELVEAEAGTLDDVGGMDALKEWLRLRGKALSPEARDFGLDPPRGVLLTGVPGCGKSLVAKTLARTWETPLVLLDPARLYGSYIGESERRLADALHTAEAMAPCVLWVDEIEKGFATGSGGGDGGVSRRVLGTFLRWMQDRPEGIFVVATSNDVRSLPPEFLRKGRFDETFFVDLPRAPEREAILRVHLARRDRDPDDFDLAALAEAADGFSGAELEAAVVGALYRAFAEDAELTTDMLLDEVSGTVPLSRTRAEDVAALRAWAAERAVPADARERVKPET